MNDLDDLYKKEDEDIVPQETAGQMDVDAANSAQSSDEEDDSDVEFVIQAKPGQKVDAPSTTTATATAASTSSSTPKVQKARFELSEKAKPQPIAKLPDVDVDEIAEMDGKSILAIDLENLPAKPWRQIGADITEYFNYGFDEFTWTAYCQKQANLRKDYTPDKVMASMMNPMMGMGMRKLSICNMLTIAGMMDPGMMMGMDFMNAGMPAQQFPGSAQSNMYTGVPNGPRNEQSPSNFGDDQAGSRIPTGPSRSSRGASRGRNVPHNSNSNRW